MYKARKWEFGNLGRKIETDIVVLSCVLCFLAVLAMVIDAR